MKMKDVFELPVDVTLKLTGEKSNHKTPDVMLITGHYVLNGSECEMVEDAINHHDKLTEENARLRELVKEFRDFASRQGWEHVLIQQADELLKGDEDE